MIDPLPWATETPENCGLETERLEAAWRSLAARATKTFLVARRGHIVFERYADDWSTAKPHYTASLAKALGGACPSPWPWTTASSGLTTSPASTCPSGATTPSSPG